MIGDALAGHFQVILTKEVSRFSRNILDTITYTRELKAAGVAVYFLNDGFHTLEPDSELKLSIMASIAQEESRRTGSRVSWGQQRQMERGVVFGHSLLGYRVRRGVLTVEPEGAGTVALIFRKYAVEGLSLRQIARYLTENGIPNRDGATVWQGGAVGKILRNEKYAGDLIQRKTYTTDFLTHKKAANQGQVPLIILRDHHEPIVSRELWDKAQARLSENKEAGGHTNRYALSGRVLCGHCGSRFVGRTKSGAAGPYRRWCCAKAIAQGSAVRAGPGGEPLGCDVGRLLRDDDGLQMVKTALGCLDIDRSAVLEQVTAIVMEVLGSGTRSAQCDRQRLTQKRQAMLDAYFAGDISREDMLVMKERYDSRLQQLSQPEERPLPDREQIKKLLAGILAGEQESPLFYRTVLHSITIFHDHPRELRLKNLDGVFFFS